MRLLCVNVRGLRGFTKWNYLKVIKREKVEYMYVFRRQKQPS